MTKDEAFERRGVWDDKGLAHLDGRRAPEFDLIDERGMTAETSVCDCCGQTAPTTEVVVRGHKGELCGGCIENEGVQA